MEEQTIKPEDKKPEETKYVTITKIVILGVFAVGLLTGLLIGYFFRATGI